MEDILKRNGTLSFKPLGQDGNAFVLMGQFRKVANKSQWPIEDIESVINECMSGDYNHLLRTLLLFQD